MGKCTVNSSWEKRAFLRRILLLFLILVIPIIASAYMADALPHKGATGLEVVIVLFFGILFAWISIGFCVAGVGFLILLTRFDRFSIDEECEGRGDVEITGRTAILVPIYNEDVARVFAGLRATCDSLKRTGHEGHFDFYVLSDTNDPDTWVEEEAAWAELCLAAGASDRIFYRNRRLNIKRKSGNIADFCRRWGKNYRYMIVFDADSVMAGATLVKMVKVMESRPDVGIFQTAPAVVNRETLIARVQQFANHVYGPMFSAGLHFWQLGDAQYWGHNAIIRIEPFMKHCALPRLPGGPPLGGEILSHDFVEAALMRRAGWGVWLGYNLAGSYEESPPTLLEELKRDRRWCQGNLQHLRLICSRGILPAHRALFLNGAMSYISALLWFLFLSLSSAEAILEGLRTPVYFHAERSLFPDWPVWNPGWALTLLASTAVILFLPKVLGVVLISVKQKRAHLFGGAGKLLLSTLAEVVFSTLLAPIRMLFHSKFVFITLLGQQVGWGAQQRDDRGTSWWDAFRFHGSGTALAAIWGSAVFLTNRSFFWWLTPIIVSLVLSIPLSVWSSRSSLGRKLREWGLFLIPEEVQPPQELIDLKRHLQEEAAESTEKGFVRAVVDPHVHAMHIALLRKRRKVSMKLAKRRMAIRERAILQGPAGLKAGEKKELLYDRECLVALHHAVWGLSDGALSKKWGL